MGRTGLTKIFIVLLVSFFISPSFARETNVQTIQRQFKERQILCLEEIAGLVSCGTMERGTALLYLEKENDRANQLLLSFQGDKSTLLQTLLVLRTLSAFRDRSERLPDRTQSHLEKEVAAFILKRRPKFPAPMKEKTVSESRQILETGMLLLWAGHVKEATPDYRWPDKKSNAEMLDRHRNDANEWLDLHAKYGFQERSSPYYRYNLAVLLTVRDFCLDDALRDKCDAVVDLMLTDIVQESIGGHWGGAQCSTLESIVPLAGDRLHILFFGQPEKPSPSRPFDPLAIQFTLHLSHTDYRPPPVLIRLGTEYEDRGIYIIKHRFPSNWRKPDPETVQSKYAYVTPSFILGAFQLRDEPVPFQARPWDFLVLDENGARHHFFTFAGNQLFSGGHPPFQQDYYLWNATTFQSKNILYCRFHRSDRKRKSTNASIQIVDRRYEQLPMRLWVPDAFTPVVQENGWWFSQMGDTYLAFRPTQGRSYWWRNAEFGQSTAGGAAILTFQDLSTAFLLEIEKANHFSSFEQFKKQVADSPLEIDNDAVTFVSRRGDVFLFPFDGGKFLVNGYEIDPKTDPKYDLYSSPYAQSKIGSSRFQANWQLFSLTLDLQNPLHPRRIIIPSR